jgi:hypothetical protein
MEEMNIWGNIILSSGVNTVVFTAGEEIECLIDGEDTKINAATKRFHELLENEEKEDVLKALQTIEKSISEVIKFLSISA